MDDMQNARGEDNADSRAHQALMNAQETADRARQEKNDFIAHLTHEVKTPLNAIIGFTEILKEYISDPMLLHYLDVIRSSGDTLLSAVNNNRELSEYESREQSSVTHCRNMKSSVGTDCDAADRVYKAVPDKDGNEEGDRVLIVSGHAYEGGVINTALKDARKEWEDISTNGMTIGSHPFIFAVDDNEDNLGIIIHFFAHDEIKVFPFISGHDLLEAIQVATPSLILLDIIMPNMDGYEVCRRLKENNKTKAIPVIFLTSKTEPDDVVRGFQSGGVDYITKPFRKDELLSRVRTHLKLYLTEQSLKDALNEKEQLLNETLKGSIKVLIDILAMTNQEAFAQTLRVRNLAKKMANRLGLVNAWEIEIGVLLSHLGCAVIPSDIVTKKQAGKRLTSEECNIFNSHPRAAARFISNIPRLEQVAISIQNQFADYDPVNDPDFIKDFIRIVFDYDNLIQIGNTQQQALDEMNARADRYNPLVLGALEAEVRKLIQGCVVKTVSFDELRPGMILADEIRNVSNIILVRRYSELSEVLLEKLQNLRYCGRSYEPVKILEQIS